MQSYSEILGFRTLKFGFWGGVIQPIIIIEPNILFNVINLWWQYWWGWIGMLQNCQKEIDQIFMSTLWLLCMSVAQSCPTLCDPVGCSLPGSSIHRILQARMLEWVAISFSRGSSLPRNQTCVSFIGSRLSTTEPPEKLQFKNLHLFTIVSVINDIPKKNRSYSFTGESLPNI